MAPQVILSEASKVIHVHLNDEKIRPSSVEKVSDSDTTSRVPGGEQFS